jgi:hypothetical protein
MPVFANCTREWAERISAAFVRGLIATALLASACGCTTTTSPAEASKEGEVVGVVRQPFQDLGIVRPDAPPVLKQAAIDLYTPPAGADCTAILDEVARLDGVLGPDIDERDNPGEPGAGDTSNLAAGAVGSLLDLPFRGIVRWVSGADARDKALAEAVLAGMLRRAFLKGFRRALACGDATEQRD